MYLHALPNILQQITQTVSFCQLPAPWVYIKHARKKNCRAVKVGQRLLRTARLLSQVILNSVQFFMCSPFNNRHLQKARLKKTTVSGKNSELHPRFNTDHEETTPFYENIDFYAELQRGRD